MACDLAVVIAAIFPITRATLLAGLSMILIIYVGAEGTCGAARSQFLDIRAAPSHDTAIGAPPIA
jgi:hypothetical protein